MYVINPGESCKCEAVANEAGLKGERLFPVFSLSISLLLSVLVFDETLIHTLPNSFIALKRYLSPLSFLPISYNISLNFKVGVVYEANPGQNLLLFQLWNVKCISGQPPSILTITLVNARGEVSLSGGTNRSYFVR